MHPKRVFICFLGCLAVFLTSGIWKSSKEFDDIEDSTNYTRLIRQITPSKKFLGEKLVHLDLKGAPPSVAYLKQFFPLVKKLGATGLLIEYEDMFPYEGELEHITAANAYTKAEVDEILESAHANGLTVIPLVQTFGHMEFVLKLPKYRSLRELDEFPQAICPSQRKAFELLREMLRQVIAAHPNSTYLHIGADEVYHLGMCNYCFQSMIKNFWGTQDLFLNHIRNISTHIHSAHPHIRPIIWGDMITEEDEVLIKKYELPDLVDIMIWKYLPDISKSMTPEVLKFYGNLFSNIWIGTAFKGATGINQIVTNSIHHLKNHASWMEIITEWKHKINFKGIALTGWQRYNHFAGLCELLPVGIPTLALCLQFLQGTSGEDLIRIPSEILGCSSALRVTSFGNVITAGECSFPGFQIFLYVTKWWTLLKFEVGNLILTGDEKAISIYSIFHEFGSRYSLKQQLNLINVEKYKKKISYMERKLHVRLLEIYDGDTVEEWITTHLKPQKIKVNALIKVLKIVQETSSWPRRPFKSTYSRFVEASEKVCSSEDTYVCGSFFLF